MKKIAFKCNTHLQMMNAVNIKMQLYPDKSADLYLDDTTDFSMVIDKIKGTMLFDRVIYLNIQTLIDEYIRSNAETRIKIVDNIKDVLDVEVDDYGDVFIGLDNVSNKLFYYYLVAQNIHPLIHLFEEGTTSFVRNYIACVKGDGMPHDKYGKDSFPNKVVEALFYEPQLFVANKSIKLTANPRPDEQVKQVYRKIYPEIRVPKEKYIFFEEALLKEKYPSNDSELLDIFADIVGKENIIIKLHPRTVVDRFSFRGYKVMEQCDVPWEIGLLYEDLSNKILVSVFSTSTITPKYIYNMKQTVIHLNKLFIGKYPLFDYNGFYNFRNILYKKYNNEDEKVFYSPSTIEELREDILFLNGEIQ